MTDDTTSWQTKPTDRFILRWIKIHLSARITPRLIDHDWLKPWMITLSSSSLGILAGIVFALGFGWLAGTIAAAAQVMDGVDGQYARLSNRQSRGGAFLDSVMDRYADGAMVIGSLVYLFRLPLHTSPWLILTAGALALVGSNLISYSTSRAENLGLDPGKPTLASKGTRSTVMIICAWGSAIWPAMPFGAILYLAMHTNLVVARRLMRAHGEV